MKVITLIKITYDDSPAIIGDTVNYERPTQFTIDKPLEIGDKLILTKSGWILKRGDDE